MSHQSIQDFAQDDLSQAAVPPHPEEITNADFDELLADFNDLETSSSSRQDCPFEYAIHSTSSAYTVSILDHSLVVWQVLSTQLVAAEQGQRHNLFQSRCKVKGQVCIFIIDGGSCNNIVSAVLVEKLGLQTRRHPHPYHMQWLNNLGTMKI